MEHVKPTDLGVPADGRQSGQIHVVVLVSERDRAICRAQERHHVRKVVVVGLIHSHGANLVPVQVHFQIWVRDVPLHDRMLRFLRSIDVGQAAGQLPVFPEEQGRVLRGLACQAS
jgi:hypothetical protein